MKTYSFITIQEALLYENLEAEYAGLLHSSLVIGHNSNMDIKLKFCETKRNKLLMEEEERWRLKSRATWIKSRNKNTSTSIVFQAIDAIKNTCGK
jgi:hypothetical protein